MDIKKYNILWNEQSKDCSETMPCGGFDSGANVWVENNNLYMYIDRSGYFDEHNQMLKTGRYKFAFSDDIFSNHFSQLLDLESGSVKITGDKTNIEVWFDVTKAKCNVEINSEYDLNVTASYESWRYKDVVDGAISSFGMNGYTGEVTTYKDDVIFEDGITFYHKNKNDKLIFDFMMKNQFLEERKDEMFNPQKDFIFGGYLKGDDCTKGEDYTGKYVSTDFKGYSIVSAKKKNHHFDITFNSEQNPSLESYLENLYKLANEKSDRETALNWWKKFWDISYIDINGKLDNSDKGYQISKNYNIFRYMLGCNAYGKYPTKFNGGLFTTDAEISVKDSYKGRNPDFRAWGGGSFTGQNQRLVYWGMLKSGDFDMMKPQFDFYNNALVNAKIRTEEYWGHGGCSFTEQLENMGLPAGASWGFPEGQASSMTRTRPKNWDRTLQSNIHVRYDFNSQLEFSFMILKYFEYTLKDISEYIPFIENSIQFFVEHYKMIHERNTGRKLDSKGKLVIFPSTVLEMYKNAENPVDTVSALRAIVQKLCNLPQYVDCKKYEEIMELIPEIHIEDGIIKPAKHYHLESTNSELPELYPVFPYGLYGVGKDNLDVAIKTWDNAPEKLKTMNVSWHQECIFTARMGLIETSKENIIKKLEDCERKFPTFWGPGHDWVPDHNWGGAGTIGLEDMLVQEVEGKIYILPAWSNDWEVKCKLHLPKNVQIEINYTDGKLEYSVFGEHKDEFEYINCLK